jgi:hypothetical protein
MKKGLIFAGIGLIVLGGLGFLFFGKVLQKPNYAALQVATTPDCKVFLDGQEAGSTPFFDDKLEVREYQIKLVPQDEASGLVSWEEKVSLVANIVTSINYQLGPEEDLLSGEILALEKVADPKTSALAVISNPGEALVRVNGESRGFTPTAVENLTPGRYEIIVSAPGFMEKTITAQTIAGYRLTVSVKLAREELEGVAEATTSAEEEEEEAEEEEEEEAEEEEEPSSSDLKKPYVKILSTPTGWLRVRLEPTTTATEAAKVNPDETFPYLDEEENGWYKIEYEEGEEGWISGVYAELVE